MPEIQCDSHISPVCITSTHTAIEQISNDPNITVGKVIGKLGPELIGIVVGVGLMAGTKKGRQFAVKIGRILDKTWDKLVVGPYNNEYPQYKNDANN